MKDVGNRIKECRLAAGMTQEEVAKHLGLGKQAVYKYEIGAVTNIPLENIYEMSLLFGVNPGYLSGWNNEKDPIPLHSEDHDLLAPDEILLVDGYRSLPDPGKEYMLTQISAAKAIYGEKDSQARDTGEVS